MLPNAMKRDVHTSMGGAARAFPTTTLGMISNIGKGDDSNRQSAVETLFERYWKPVYHFIRVNWRKKSNEEAKDLTQGFFMWVLESDVLTNYELKG